MTTMQFRHVRAFLAVAETGSIRTAAQHLGMSQPALSKTIQELEAYFSAPLVTRSAQGSVPTEYGRAFLKRALAINGEFERAKEEIDQMLDAKTGTVAVGLSAIAAMLLASGSLEIFWKGNPGIHVRIVDGVMDRLIGAVRQGEVDFAIGGMLPNSLSHELTAEPLYNNYIVPVVRKGHPLAGARSLTDLTQANWLFTNGQPTFMALMAEQFSRLGLPAPRVVLTCESFPTLLEIVPNSDLVAALPRSVLGHPRVAASMKALDLSEPAPYTQVSLISRAGVPLTPLADRLARSFRRTAKRIQSH